MYVFLDDMDMSLDEDNQHPSMKPQLSDIKETSKDGSSLSEQISSLLSPHCIGESPLECPDSRDTTGYDTQSYFSQPQDSMVSSLFSETGVFSSASAGNHENQASTNLTNQFDTILTTGNIAAKRNSITASANIISSHDEVGFSGMFQNHAPVENSAHDTGLGSEDEIEGVSILQSDEVMNDSLIRQKAWNVLGKERPQSLSRSSTWPPTRSAHGWMKHSGSTYSLKPDTMPSK